MFRDYLCVSTGRVRHHFDLRYGPALPGSFRTGRKLRVRFPRARPVWLRMSGEVPRLSARYLDRTPIAPPSTTPARRPTLVCPRKRRERSARLPAIVLVGERMLVYTAICCFLAVAQPTAAIPPPQRDDARAAFDFWLQCQNRRNFKAYEALYSNRKPFEAFRLLPGPRFSSYDRAAWLREQRRLISHKVRIRAEGVTAAVMNNGTLYTFTERSTWGTREHAESKDVFFLKTPAGFRITRETVGPAPTPTPPSIDDPHNHFSFVVDGEVVLSRNPDDAWALGPPSLEETSLEDDQYLLRTKRAVDVAKLPTAIAHLKGTFLRLVDARGTRCNVMVDGFLLRGRVLTNDSSTDAQFLWDLSGHTLVATLQNASACNTATWAVPANSQNSVIFGSAPSTTEIRELALDAFRALPESRRIQRTFSRWYKSHTPHQGAAPDWFQIQGQPRVETIDLSPVAPPLVSVSAYLLGDLDDDDRPSGTLWALWQLERVGTKITLTLRNVPDGSLALNVSGAVLLPSDNSAALLFDGIPYLNVLTLGGYIPNGVIRMNGDLYRDVEGPQIPFHVRH
jgi:hypothetical protein